MEVEQWEMNGVKQMMFDGLLWSLEDPFSKLFLTVEISIFWIKHNCLLLFHLFNFELKLDWKQHEPRIILSLGHKRNSISEKLSVQKVLIKFCVVLRWCASHFISGILVFVQFPLSGFPYIYPPGFPLLLPVTSYIMFIFGSLLKNFQKGCFDAVFTLQYTCAR